MASQWGLGSPFPIQDGNFNCLDPVQVKGRYLQVLQVGVATDTYVQRRPASYSTCSFNPTSVLTHKPWWVGVRGIIHAPSVVEH